MKRLQHTEQTDRVIREAYASQDYATRRKAVPAACKRLGWQRFSVYNRAITLGVVVPMRKQPEWAPEEGELLERNAHLSNLTLKKMLKKRGYHRSAAAIDTHRKRIANGLRQSRVDAGLYSAQQAGLLLGASSKTACNWIAQGMLKAKRRGPEAGEGAADHWEIREKDLRQFVIDYTAHVNFARVDKYWLVDLLTNSSTLKRAL